jgi:hypothetical protein
MLRSVGALPRSEDSDSLLEEVEKEAIAAFPSLRPEDIAPTTIGGERMDFMGVKSALLGLAQDPVSGALTPGTKDTEFPAIRSQEELDNALKATASSKAQPAFVAFLARCTILRVDYGHPLLDGVTQGEPELVKAELLSTACLLEGVREVDYTSIKTSSFGDSGPAATRVTSVKRSCIYVRITVKHLVLMLELPDGSTEIICCIVLFGFINGMFLNAHPRQEAKGKVSITRNGVVTSLAEQTKEATAKKMELKATITKEEKEALAMEEQENKGLDQDAPDAAVHAG